MSFGGWQFADGLLWGAQRALLSTSPVWRWMQCPWDPARIAAGFDLGNALGSMASVAGQYPMKPLAYQSPALHSSPLMGEGIHTMENPLLRLRNPLFEYPWTVIG